MSDLVSSGTPTDSSVQPKATATLPTSRVLFLGYPLDAVTARQALERFEDSIRRRSVCTHACINASVVVAMRRDALLAAAIGQADVITADGQGVVWAARLLGADIPERVAATDLMEQLIDLGEREGFGVYFLGSTEGVLADLVRHVRRTHPALTICGFHHGFYRDAEEALVVDAIRAAAPDMLFLGMSSPRKEMFMATHRSSVNVPLMMGVGGAFEVLAGHRKRAPLFARRHGLEWLFRMMQEPRRLWRRYLIGNLVFTRIVAAELLRSALFRRK